MFSIVGTEFSSAPLLRGCETAMKFVLVQLRPRVGRGWRGGGRHQTNLSLAIYSIIYRYMLYRVTVLVENVEDGREYTVEEIHNSDSEISQISVQDPLRYLYLYTKTRTKTKTKTKQRQRHYSETEIS